MGVSTLFETQKSICGFLGEHMPTNHAFVLCLLSTSSIDICILLDMNCKITYRQDWKLLGVLKLQIQ